MTSKQANQIKNRPQPIRIFRIAEELGIEPRTLYEKMHPSLSN